MFAFSSFHTMSVRPLARLLYTTLSLLLAVSVAYGKEQTYVSAPLVGSSISVNQSVGVFDQVYKDNFGVTPNPVEGYNWIKNSLVLAFDTDDNKVLPSTPFTLKVYVEVKLWFHGSNPDLTESQKFNDELLIKYDPTLSKITDLRCVKAYTNAIKMEVRVRAASTISGAVQAVNLPKHQLFCEIQVSRQFRFAPTLPLSNSTAVLDGVNQRIVFSWDAKNTSGANAYADDYDIEWNFYETESNFPYLDAAQRNATFRFNASRMTVAGTTAWLPFLYRKGYIFYRVRAGRYLANGMREMSIWTNANYLQIAGHEDKLNWQADMTFAEEGKKASTIKYFDGTLRERQAVSQSVANKTTYATQTIYDLAGRATVKTMPLPTQNQVIKYEPNLADVSNNQAYGPAQFENINNCNQATQKMFTGTSASNAAKYFSANNPLLPDGTNRFKRPLIPDAEGFHFTLSQFTPDQTGRIKRQSGVGAAFHINPNADRTTRYYYGKPSQEELDRLFGTEVGYASHYQKNMVKDPNGQVAVSYVDAHGRTIATALAGAKPSSLAGLTSLASEVIVHNIKNNVRQGDSLISTYALLVTNPSENIDVMYQLSGSDVKSDCLPANICYDCEYEVTIRVADDCQNSFIPNNTTKQPYKWEKTSYVAGSTLFDTNCLNLRDSIKRDSFKLNLTVGEYRVTKVLRVSRRALDFYTDHYLKQAACIPNRDSIVKRMMANVDSTGCVMDCESCKAQLGDTTTFYTKFLAQVTQPPTDEDREAARVQYRALLGDCDNLCLKSDECQTLYDLMLLDVTPNPDTIKSGGGQYALYNSAYGWTTDTTSIFSLVKRTVRVGGFNLSIRVPRYQSLPVNTVFVNAAGQPDFVQIGTTTYKPQQLTPQQFIENWKPSWAKALVQLHPEYCAYQSCINKQKCNGFDDKILNINTYSAALAAGVLDTEGVFKGDSCFLSGLDTAYRDSIRIRFTQNMTDPGNCYGYSAVNFVTNTIYGPGNVLGQGSAADNDQAWLMLRALYLGYKAQIKSRWQVANCQGTPMECIGTGRDTCMGKSPNPYKNKIRRVHLFDTFSKIWTESELQQQAQQNRDSMLLSYRESCTENTNAWMEQLGACNLTPAQKENVKLRLIAVCQMACDSIHPFGASSTKNSQLTTYGDSSFTHIINQVKGTQSVCSDCNGNLINFPGPYYAPVYNGATVIHKKSDAPSCLYTNLTALETCHTASASPLTFSQWLLKYSEFPLNKQEIDTLKKYFNPSNTSSYLPIRVSLPPYLECNKCVTCTDVQNLRNQFNLLCANDNTFTYWERFARFANNKMGFILKGEDYYNFLINTCPATTPSVCTTQKLLCPRSPYGYDESNESCTAGLLAQVLIQADLSYQAKLDSVRRAFEARYIDKCLTAAESKEIVQLRQTSQEYHHTLYYYDQAGNLVKTVPPSGVAILPQSVMTAVGNARNMGMAYVATHALETKYIFNSLNQSVQQKSPDAEAANFWYDRIGRLVVSQDGRQKDLNKYSYTRHDALGRVREVGELKSTSAITDAIVRHPTGLGMWISVGTREFITETYYDEPRFNLTAPLSGKGQNNLRNRVVSSVTRRFASTVDTDYQTASHYSYDVVGNVRTLLQEIRELHPMDQGYKTIDYDYDQLSGKVNSVVYQSGKIDQFAHRYLYDADNKLIAAYTTTRVATFNKAMPQPNWQYRQEATYDYYQHGPLARSEIGDRRVQGLDYVYSLQGWLKGINSDSLDVNFDAGRDGLAVSQPNLNNPNTPPIVSRQFVGRDAAGFSIGYFVNDYIAINGASMSANGNNLSVRIEREKASAFYLNTPQLFNGNIRQMRVAVRALNYGKVNGNNNPSNGGANGVAMGYTYNYDQLNRLTQMDAWQGNFTTPSKAYRERVRYDANGNIEAYLRHNAEPSGVPMDNLTYNYTKVNNKLLNNQLLSVRDLVGNNIETTDIDDQTANGTNLTNYSYDKAGNMVKDKSEGVSVVWNAYGKITDVTKTTTNNTLTYGYDPMQNRSIKISKTATSEKRTYYFRDAQGNVLATYERVNNELFWDEQYIYGSSRLGLVETNRKMYPLIETDTAYRLFDTEGNRRYEIANHLGNVLAVVSDRKQGLGNSGGNFTAYDAVTISATDYYPFGMSMPGRTYNAPNTEKYRYSFNGKEDDDEWAKQDYGARIYDKRIGRWLSIDPKVQEFPNNSPYSFAFNNPIVLVDNDGEIPIIPIILKMASSAASDYLMQVGMNYFFNDESRGDLNKSMEKVDWLQVSRSGLEGAIPWKTPGGKLGKAAATATVDVLQNYAKATYNGQDYNSGDAVKDFMTGFISDLAGGGLGDLVSKYGANSVAKGLQKLGFNDKKIAETFESSGIKYKKCGCFTEGTLVLTAHGYKPIQTIAVGDSVWAYSDSLGSIKLQKVIKIFNRIFDEYFIVSFGGQKLEVTHEHPFFIGNKWVKAQDLRVGDKLTTYDKQQFVIESIKFIQKGAPITVYNFTVQNYHTYYVSLGNVLVHNGDPCDLTTGGAYGKFKNQNDEAGKLATNKNHIPSKKSYALAGYKISNYFGSAHIMTTADHKAYVTTGSGSGAKAFRNLEGSLLKAGDFMGAFNLNVKEIQKIHGNKYDKAIEKARIHFRDNVIPELASQSKKK